MYCQKESDIGMSWIDHRIETNPFAKRRRGLVISRVTHVCCVNAIECSRCNPIFVEEFVASYASVCSLFIL